MSNVASTGPVLFGFTMSDLASSKSVLASTMSNLASTASDLANIV